MAKRRKKRKTKRSRGNKSKLRLVIIMILGVIIYSSSDSIKNLIVKPVVYEGYTSDIELPKIKDSTYFVRNNEGRFSYLYSPKDKQSSWVAYRLTKKDIDNPRKKRENNFQPDNVVIKNGWKSASKKDYYKTAYDRGHLLPSADRNENKNRKPIYVYLFKYITSKSQIKSRRLGKP